MKKSVLFAAGSAVLLTGMFAGCESMKHTDKARDAYEQACRLANSDSCTQVYRILKETGRVTTMDELMLNSKL